MYGMGAIWHRAMVAGAMADLVRRGELRDLAKAAMTESDDAILSSKQVGLLLGRHHKTIEKWTRTRGLPCFRTGRNLGFRRGDVLRWQAQQEG